MAFQSWVEVSSNTIQSTALHLPLLLLPSPSPSNRIPDTVHCVQLYVAPAALAPQGEPQPRYSRLLEARMMRFRDCCGDAGHRCGHGGSLNGKSRTDLVFISKKAKKLFLDQIQMSMVHSMSRGDIELMSGQPLTSL
jgi:hypothetical protein